MWRINNIMLSIVLAGIILLSAVIGYGAISWEFEQKHDRSVRLERALDANETVDDQGRVLRDQSISFHKIITDKNWGAWDLVRIEQTALLNKTLVDDDENLLGTLNGRSERYSRANRFANNFVLRNRQHATQEILFSSKVAIQSITKISNRRTPGVAIAYADQDTNEDGKLDNQDGSKVIYFKFGEGAGVNIPISDTFHSFVARRIDDPSYVFEVDEIPDDYTDHQPVFSFRTFKDFDGNGEFEDDFEPQRLHEVDVETGTVTSAINDELSAQLQSIIDGPGDNSQPQ